MSAKPHWTQTPEGRKRMAEVQTAAWAKRHKKEKAHAAKVKATTNHKPPTAKRLAHAELERLARIGAAQELIDLERRLTKLKLFLSIK